jgi:predicted  nucleic acid-binding Zn-ribbon protein
MEEKQASGFTFGNDDSRSPSTIDGGRPRKNRRKDRSVRGLFFFLFILIALGGVFIYGYIDMKTRVARLEAVRQQEDKKLSEDLEARLMSMMTRFEELEKSLTKKVFPMDEVFLALESTTESLETSLKDVEERIERIDETKAGKATLSEAVNALTASIQPSQEAIEAAGSRIDAVEERVETGLTDLESRIDQLSTQLTGLAEAVDKATASFDQAAQGAEASSERLDRIEARLGELASEKISQQALDLALANLETSLQKEISRIAGRVQTARSELDALRTRTDVIERLARSAASRSESAGPSKTVEVPEPGTFLEQDLQ